MKYRLLKFSVFAATVVVIFTYVDIAAALDGVADIPIISFIALLFLVFTNFLTTSFRLVSVVKGFGAHLSLQISMLANASGLVASLFVVNLVGSTLGRQIFLQKVGFPVSFTTLIALYEKVLIATVSALLAIGGAVIILGIEEIVQFLDHQPFSVILPIALLALFLATRLVYTGSNRNVIRQSLNDGNAPSLFAAFIITLLSAFLNSFSYVLLVKALGYENDVLQILSAAAIISFAASLPITVNGWGVRELVAIFVLGFLGLSEADALLVSVTVGFANLLVVFLISPFLIIFDPFSSKSSINAELLGPKKASEYKITHLAVLIFILFSGVLIFFQVPIVFKDTTVTVNLADPIALLVFGFVVTQFLLNRSLPFEVPPAVKFWVLALTGLLITTLLIGWARNGFTSWAFGNRGFGWVILIGYFCTGALVTSVLGSRGLKRLLNLMLFTATFVLVSATFHILMFRFGLLHVPYPPNFEGFSGNRNAYAFQMLALVAVSLPWLLGRHAKLSVMAVFLIGMALLGAFLSGSLTGFATVAVLVAFVATFAVRELRNGLLLATAAALCVWLLLPVVYDAAAFVLDGVFVAEEGRRPEFATAPMLNQSSLAERLRSYVLAIEMWLGHPIFGAGLGAFILSTSLAGEPLVVHSTYLWILAEMGLIGFFVIFSLPIIATWSYWRRFCNGESNTLRGLSNRETSLVLLVLVFAIFSLMHDVAFQRLFWLLLGSLLSRRLTHPLRLARTTVT